MRTPAPRLRVPAPPYLLHVHPAAVIVATPAKLNLYLEILGKRPDGYHQLETLMVAIDLYDTLECTLRTDGQIVLECDHPALPRDAANLAVQAALRLREWAGRPELGATLRLHKRIPLQAGLGGGSSDAAAALVALQQLWKLALTRHELLAMAASVGSDVPFFLSAAAAWCTGRGEVVEAEWMGDVLHAVVVCPPRGLSTAEVYRQVRVPAAPRNGTAARAALQAGDAAALAQSGFNRLQEAAFLLDPRLETLCRRLAARAPWGAMLSGSGSALFALCPSRDHARTLAAAIRTPTDEPAPRVFVVRSVPSDGLVLI